MKRIYIVIFILLPILSACTNPIKIQNQKLSTPMDAANAFVEALTTENVVLLNQVVYRSQSIPTDEIMGIAKLRKIIKMKASDFTYKADPKDKETIYVKFKDHQGNKDTWKLVFVKNQAGHYQFDGFLSGTLMANTTINEVTNSYLETLIHNADKYWLQNLVIIKNPGGYNNLAELKEVAKYKLYKKKLKDFTTKTLYQSPESITLAIQVATSVHHTKTLDMLADFVLGDDGYYIPETWPSAGK